MTHKKDRDRVMAEITLPHLLRLANEHGCSVSRQQALAFLNDQGRAFEMWRHDAGRRRIHRIQLATVNQRVTT
jgi:sarcosine oxidase delta subunit